MNKIAIVTGASQGIGRGIALKLAKEGYDIAFSFFSATQSAEELCAEIQSTTAQRCAMYCVDMRKDGAGAKFVNQVSEEMGVPCVLVNNAGRTRMESILDITPETVDELINLDLKNYLFCMQAAATQMVRAKISGSIINITSTRAERAYPCDAVYGGVKAALNRASQSAALDLAPYGIRVNCVAPGAIAVRSKEYLQKLSIIRACDDCICIKACPLPSPAACCNVKNVHVHGCTLWNAEPGNALEIGYELRCNEVSDIVFFDCDIIHCEYEGNQSGGVLTIHNADRANVHNILYENIRIEDAQEKLVDIS